MCQCGCADFDGDFKFKGPGDITYLLQVYPSCEDCEMPAGVVIYAFSPEDCENWGVDAIPEISLDNVGRLVGVVDPGRVKENWSRAAGDPELLEYMEPDIRSGFIDAVNHEISENRKHHGNHSSPQDSGDEQ